MTVQDNFLRFTAQTSPNPLLIEVERAEGIYIYGPEGRKYMDLISGISVVNVGHRHPKVVEAIKQQTDKYLHVMAYGEYVQKPVVELANDLVNLLPDNLNSVYFVNSGTEANEGALKLAKRQTGRTEIVAFNKSYHGNTQGSLSASGNENKKYAFRPLIPDIRFIDFNNISSLSLISNKTAAVIIEPIQGDAGVILPENGFLEALREKCNETGAMLIFDEIQTGFGRTGTMFAFEQYHVIPDILTMAKAMGGGLPIGAFVASYDVMQKLTYNPMLGHITTFGGNPVCCAASRAVLDILTTGTILQDVEEKGKLFEELLKNSAIKEIRRKGLMMAIDFENEEYVERIVQGCIDQGIITYFFLSNKHSFRIAPPLTIELEEIREACTIINKVINKLKINE
jgi:acetylornithine/succinyldiaminopimelate/putrescine aminotransferase